jgi:hypothetical protein
MEGRETCNPRWDGIVETLPIAGREKGAREIKNGPEVWVSGPNLSIQDLERAFKAELLAGVAVLRLCMNFASRNSCSLRKTRYEIVIPVLRG